MQAEALEEQSAWCRRFAQINAVGLRKARIPSTSSNRHIDALYFMSTRAASKASARRRASGCSSAESLRLHSGCVI